MEIAARPAAPGDLDVLLVLYETAAAEQEALHGAWGVADALAEPVAESLAAAVTDADTWLLVGTIDGLVFGFLLARSEPLLPQAGDMRKAAIRLVYTAPEVRGVGVGHAMIEHACDGFAESGHRFVDAHVLPGHRLAKNFFEAHGFAARSIIMHRK